MYIVDQCADECDPQFVHAALAVAAPYLCGDLIDCDLWALNDLMNTFLGV